ncbi:Trehalase [Caenorhabditis elegans]|uniref:Trehalase n=2 Tax=Caenorhabditis elegans TaxID=6239 RepID=G5EC40_CAEEL|nr:Trehalase [Caenorhabditis elegans]CAD54510.1 trehalase [Caenorhabditis elegans]CCD71475.1 Trehalase [Caenorhabditis elegans]|eukprot:NP_491890.2 Trehalase [Caenorhabditis elegans]
MLYTVINLLAQIYCNGPILQTVQDSHMFPDSKHFVDMSLKYDPITTLRHFDELGDRTSDMIILREFVTSHFNPPGSELVEWFPPDWVDFPSNFLNIHDYHHRRWALHLHRIWKDLCRKVRDDVKHRQDHYSLLYVPHPFIIPGGRFLEFYYWDTFWILKGLLFSEMYETARGVIKNLGYMVDNHGFVPNGGRVYYLTRSQPPLLTPMVYEYYMSTGDLDFVMEILPTLDKEYEFWIKNRQEWFKDKDGVKQFPYYQYKAKLKVPRPESYREDSELAEHLQTEAEKIQMWSEIASAAETGWDFSTRWFSQNGDTMHRMDSIRTWSIIPADLNAFMCANARILASLYEIAGDFKKVKVFEQRYTWAKREMRELHWNETDGIWYDYDIELKTHSNQYYVSNAVPLYAKCYDDDDDIPHRVHDYLERQGLLKYTKGLPTSLAMSSTQQWDKENAWPPMIHMVIEGFRTTGDIKLMKVAEKMATSWLTGTYQSFIRTHAMFEKYNVTPHTEETSGGGGGEYEVQTGFGWTNGVILDLLDKYGDQFASSSTASKFSFSLSNITFVVFILYIFS